MNKKPNLFIVGAAKSGTTSLYHYLDQHPDVHMSPIKEPHYFCKDIRCKDFTETYKKNVCFDVEKYLRKKNLEKKHISFVENHEEYLQLFRDARRERYLGETSTGYLYSSIASNEIYKFNHESMIIMVLRNPIERAFSHWTMDLRGNDVYRESFVGAIKDDMEKTDKGWGKSHLYIELGLYYEQVKRYLEIFPEKQILILMYDDLKNNQKFFFSELFNFLKITPSNIDSNKKYNSAGIPAYPMLRSLLKQLGIINVASKILPLKWKKNISKTMTNTGSLPELRKKDIDAIKYHFIDDIQKLEKLINRDLSSWI